MENFKKITNFERYLISNEGIVFDTLKNKEIIHHDKKGYKRLALSAGKNKQKLFYIHRLLAFAFIPNPLKKPFINHIDGNKSNNKIENLEWCTQKENIQHACATGLLINQKGEKARNAKLTNEIVLNISYDFKKLTNKQMMEKYNVSKSTINNILTGNKWHEITGIIKRKLSPDKKNRWV
jgi:hypothetical protein